jgi:hypothetical protein
VQPLPRPHPDGLLKRDTDRNSRVGIPAVIQVVAIIDIGYVNVVVVVPVIAPVFRPGVNGTDPIAFVLEARVSAYNHEGEAVDAKPVVSTKVSAVAVIRNAVAVVATALSPSAMVRIPAL